MSEIDALICEAAMKRVSDVFKVSLGSLRPEMRFGEELKNGFVSDFKRNEFDQINDDIHDVADRKVTKELASGELIIATVDDYCRHMIRCYATKPDDVRSVLRIGKNDKMS